MASITATVNRDSVETEIAPEATTDRVDMSGGVAAALLVTAWVLLWDRRVGFHGYWAAGSMVAALLLLMRPIWRRRVLGRTLRALLVASGAMLVIFSVDHALASLEDRAPRFGAVSAIASVVLELLGYDTASERGLLLLDHPEGLVTVVPSMEKLAVRPLGLFWLAWSAIGFMRDRRFRLSSAIVGLAGTAVVGIVRYVLIVAAYFEHDEILTSGAGQSALDLFTSPCINAAALIAAGVVTRFGGDLSLAEPAKPALVVPRTRSLVRAAAVVACLSWTAGLAWIILPPGAEKAGRVIVDDRFCGIWEPTARELDTEWYGDFPTYSFTSLAEWLGRWFSVDANTSKPYDDALLSKYDVLIIKTPETAIPEAELAAIDRFVQRGGGLLLVGDHTNLLGMGTHLNAISARYGIRFRYDSVSDGPTGAFVDYYGPKIGRPVGALHVEHLQFMTSCSLLIDGSVEPVLAVEDCRREPHDYASSSFFGRRGPHPEMEQGRTVLAATTRVGRGRIAAFTDSTVWSSFAAFSYDREKLAMDLVRLLNREPSGYETLMQRLAFAAAMLAVCAAVLIMGSGMALPAFLVGLTSFWIGVSSGDALNRLNFAWPAPSLPVSEVTFLWQGGSCAFPPVLGTPDSLPADRSFDTLLVSVQRLGLIPRVAYTYDEDLLSPDTRALFVVAPVDTPPARTMARIKHFVQTGGNLIVLDDLRFAENGSAKDFLSLFGASIAYHMSDHSHGAHSTHVHVGGGLEPIKIPSADAFAARKRIDQGQIVYMSDAADFSRQGLGHCFARPWKAARARYDTVYAIIRDALGIAPTDRRTFGVL